MFSALAGIIKKIHRRINYGKSFGYGVLPLLVLTVIVLEILSHSAAYLFNYAMERQEMLKGTITVEEIYADLTGHVVFENLEWKDPKGNTLLLIPDGRFAVRLWDVVTLNFKSTTIQDLTLNNAMISFRLNDNMEPDVVRPSPDAKPVTKVLEKHEEGWEDKADLTPKTEEEMRARAERRRRRQQQQMQRDWQNFNQEGRKIKLDLALNQCSMEIFYKERHYLLGAVYLEAHIDTDKELFLRAHTGRFGGTMVGEGMSIHGTMDFRNEIEPECNLAILLQDVDPDSLGFSMNVNDKMTLQTNFTGYLSAPYGTGRVHMDRLRLPGIRFDDVEGEIEYQDGEMEFKNVTARVYGGTLNAVGKYNLDTRHYSIDGHGEGLQASKALPGADLSCNVTLDIFLKSKGAPKTTTLEGYFNSGPGYYQWVPFDGLHGSFTNAYRDLRFYDVTVDFGDYRIVTDAFSIVNKELRVNPIHLLDARGNTVMSYQARDHDHPQAKLY